MTILRDPTEIGRHITKLEERIRKRKKPWFMWLKYFIISGIIWLVYFWMFFTGVFARPSSIPFIPRFSYPSKEGWIMLFILGVAFLSYPLYHLSSLNRIRLRRLYTLKEKVTQQIREESKRRELQEKISLLRTTIKEAEKRGINAEKEKEVLRELEGEK